MKHVHQFTLLSCLLLLASPLVAAGQSADAPDLDLAVVRSVRATESPDTTWRFDVTVEHNDEGWDHYADAWQLLSPDTMEVIAERILLHPHDNEQPFTRSQSGITIPEGLTSVLVRARCTVHGPGEVTVLVDLKSDEGDHFTVRRAR